MNNLEDHIDEPIKKAVVGMSLLGFKTYMSCCGFDYKGEKVKKSHLGKAYIYLDVEQIKKSGDLSNKLIWILSNSGWKINFRSKFLDFYADGWETGSPWNNKDSVHYYEIFLCGISGLVKTIENMKEAFSLTDVVIEDGNKWYKENVSQYWEYEPTEPWTVNREIYESLKV